jgi:glucose-6-phosphate isomerase
MSGNLNSGKFDWEKGFTIDFDLKTGLSKKGQSSVRKLSNLKGMFADNAACDKMIAEGDPLVYEFYELGAPEDAGDVAFGSSITYPGKVGNEYFFTKGHFHTILETAEVYYCLAGEGFMLIESPEGDTQALPLSAGETAYVPKRYAHRSINTGSTPLITFFAFRGDAGHNYGSIEEKGYRKIIVEVDGKPQIIDNPNWK